MAYRAVKAGSAVSVAVFLAIGCGNTIYVVTGSTGTSSGGAGGAGGLGTSVVTSSTGIMGTSVTTVTTGDVNPAVVSSTATGVITGPPDPCQEGCAVAASCNTPFCDANTCNDPTQACFASCFANANCAEIDSLKTNNPDPGIEDCLEGCQSETTGTEGAGGSFGAGGAGQVATSVTTGNVFPVGVTTGSMTTGNVTPVGVGVTTGSSMTASTSTGGTQLDCGKCINQNKCIAPIQCFQDPKCQAWGECVFQCNTSSCFDLCDAEHPEAQMYQIQLYECMCSDCPSDCSYVDPCAKTPPTNGPTSVGSGL